MIETWLASKPGIRCPLIWLSKSLSATFVAASFMLVTPALRNAVTIACAICKARELDGMSETHLGGSSSAAHTSASVVSASVALGDDSM